MGNNSGRVSSATSISGGLKVCTIEVGRDPVRGWGFWAFVGDDAVFIKFSADRGSRGLCWKSEYTGSRGGDDGRSIALCRDSEGVRECELEL
jgi:hypothetical protein